MLTLEQKQTLAEAAQSGVQIFSIAFNPNTTDGDPIDDAITGGLFSFLRLDSGQLNQAVLTSTNLL